MPETIVNVMLSTGSTDKLDTHTFSMASWKWTSEMGWVVLLEKNAVT